MRFLPVNPRLYAVGQVASAFAAAALLISAPVQVLFALSVRGAGLFVVTALLSGILVWPLLLYLRATPPLTIDEGGLTLTPRIGRPANVPWSAVREVKPYPLLPSVDTESLRRAAVGRKKYSEAEGLMLTSDALPWTYKAVGWFAGEGFRGAFAVTNRSHANYSQAKYLVEKHMK